MHRIDTAGATPDHHFQDGDPSTGTPSTVIDASFMNSTQDELCNVIEAAGIALSADNDQLLKALKLLLAPAGIVQAFAGAAAPAGWLECAGQSLARATYPALFAAIGTRFGSVDADHFTLPDGRGEFLRGWDHGRGVDVDRDLGSFQDYATAAPRTVNVLRLNGDGTTSALTSASNPSHVGFARASKTTEVVTAPSADATDSGAQLDVVNASTGDAETRPRNLAMMWIIKV